MEDIVQLLEPYYDDLILFAEEVCGLSPRRQQRILFQAIMDHKYVTCRSGHKIGKTTVLSVVSLWLLTTHPATKITVLSGGGASGMETSVVPEMLKWRSKMPLIFQELVSETLEQTWSTGSLYIRSPQINREDTVIGTHAEEGTLCFILDEASGLRPLITDAIQGSLQGTNTYAIMAGNPRTNTGFFADSHRGIETRFHRLHFSSLDNEALDRDWANDILRKYGKDSIEYRTKVLGEFPLQESDALISYEKTVLAMARTGVERIGEIVFALDPARMGEDFCVLTGRQGGVVTFIKELKGKVKSTALLGWCIHELKALPKEQQPNKLIIDCAGLGGPIFDFVEDMFEKELPSVHVIEMNPGEASKDKKKYHKMKDQMYCALRDYIRDDEPQLPDHPVLLAEMSSIKYRYDLIGAIEVLKKELKKSPDYLDSLAYTFYGAGYAKANFYWA